MTDRIKGCWVAFDRDYRVDDVEAILDAIRMTKGVAAVSTNETVTSMDDWMARQHVKREIANKVLALHRELYE